MRREASSFSLLMVFLCCNYYKDATLLDSDELQAKQRQNDHQRCDQHQLAPELHSGPAQR